MQINVIPGNPGREINEFPMIADSTTLIFYLEGEPGGLDNVSKVKRMFLGRGDPCNDVIELQSEHIYHLPCKVYHIIAKFKEYIKSYEIDQWFIRENTGFAILQSPGYSEVPDSDIRFKYDPEKYIDED